MPLRQIRSSLLRTPTIPTFCIITRCEDFQYLDGPHLPFHQIFYHLPQTLVLSIREPNEG